MDDVIIKKCPFCGGLAYLHQNYSYKTRYYFVYVKCEICGGRGKTYRSEEEPAEEGWNNEACLDAINAWNMRADL